MVVAKWFYFALDKILYIAVLPQEVTSHCIDNIIFFIRTVENINDI